MGTTRVAVAATATALVVGVVGVVLAIDDRRRAASNITIPSPQRLHAERHAIDASYPKTDSEGPSTGSAATPEYEESERE